MTITIDKTSSIINTCSSPARMARGSRPGWRQTAVAFRAQVTTTVFTAPQQLTLFDTAPYLKGVK